MPVLPIRHDSWTTRVAVACALLVTAAAPALAGKVTGELELSAPAGKPPLRGKAYLDRIENPYKAPRDVDPFPYMIVVLEGDAAKMPEPPPQEAWDLVGDRFDRPLIAVVPVSFTPNRYLSVPDAEWSLRHYRTLIEKPEWAQGVWLSIRVGVVASLFATTLATAFALGVWMLQPRFAPLLMGLALLPMVAPPVVSALTLYFFLITLSKMNGIIAYDTWAGVVLAHSVMIAPFAVVLVSVALAQLDRRIDLAARSMGAGIATRVFGVILPNIRFTLLTALFLTFVLSWEEIGVTLFITSVDAVTLPRLMLIGLRDNIDPVIAAISVVLIAIVVTVILAKTLWQIRSKGTGAQ